MRQTSEVTDTEFPYAEDTTAFILVMPEDAEDTKDSRGFDHASTFDKKLGLINRAMDLEEREHYVFLLAVWPGSTRSDVFLVDDLDAALAAFA